MVPNHIYKEIEEFYYKGTLRATPPRKKFGIITPKLANIIANWSDNKYAGDIRTEKYRFKLIYRGSRDGISNASFKNKCKGQIASLILIKVQRSAKTFGGYSSIGFNSIENNFSGDDSQYYYSSDNFIFSFKTIKYAKNKISRVAKFSEAIIDNNNTAFNFG